MTGKIKNTINKMTSLLMIIQNLKSTHIRKISSVQLFATNRCNSRCKICYIWVERPKIDLDLDIIKKILKSPTIEKNALWGLLGGEFILHPEYDKIIELFNKYKKNYVLFSNGILNKKVVETVKEFNISKVILSLDGTKETYTKVRGLDMHDNVINVIEELKDKTDLWVTYVINPLNSREDFIYVKKIAEKYNIGLGVAIYDNRHIYHNKIKSNKLYSVDDIYKSNYLRSYKLWVSGKLRIPCYSIRTNLTIMPNGDVPLCQQKNVVLGNLQKNSLETIWESAKSLQDKYKDCNGCWLNCYKLFDNTASQVINTFLPQFISNRIIGKYTWNTIGKII